MEAATAIQVATALASLITQIAPLAIEVKQALANGDEAQLKAILTRLQAANDGLGTAP